MFARIEDRVVAELWNIAELPPLHESLLAKYVPVPDGVDVAEGYVYDGSSFAAPAPVIPTWHKILAERDRKLNDTDWMFLTDAPTRADVQAWQDYRQALRDIRQNFATPEEVIWPTKPGP